MSNWRKCKLEEIAKSDYGLVDGPFGSNLPATAYTSFGIPVVRGVNLSLGQERFQASNYVFVAPETARKLKRSLSHPNDIIFTKKGTLGQTGIIPKNQEFETFLISSNQMKLSVDEAIADPLFVYYFVSSPFSRDRIIQDSMTTGVPKINLTYLRNFQILLPPIDEQKKIAAILSAYDDLIENNNKRIALLEKAAEEIYREWFVRMRFPGWEAVKFEKGIPEGWEYLKFNKVTNNFDKKRIPLSGIERDKIKGEIPYYGAAAILDHISKYIFDGKYLLIAEDGSVITQEGYPVLQFINEKFWVNNHAHIIQGKDSVFSTEWIYLSLKRYPILGHVTGVAQPKINQENLNRIKILVPKTETLEKFNEVVVPIFDDIFLTQKSIFRLKKSRDLLLWRLISGKLPVEDLDIRFPPSMIEDSAG